MSILKVNIKKILLPNAPFICPSYNYKDNEELKGVLLLDHLVIDDQSDSRIKVVRDVITS